MRRTIGFAALALALAAPVPARADVVLFDAKFGTPGSYGGLVQSLSQFGVEPSNYPQWVDATGISGGLIGKAVSFQTGSTVPGRFFGFEIFMPPSIIPPAGGNVDVAVTMGYVSHVTISSSTTFLLGESVQLNGAFPGPLSVISLRSLTASPQYHAANLFDSYSYSSFDHSLPLTFEFGTSLDPGSVTFYLSEVKITSTVPEPSPLLLCGLALAGAGCAARARRP
jgi:hypothetical protein